MQEKELGLRERQRLETLRALRTAAVELVNENGLTETTVSAIADRAGVSRRTFFNYYACKEDAVLGASSPALPEQELADFVDTPPGPDRLTKAVLLVVGVGSSIRQAGGTHADHRELVRKYPALIERMQHHGTTAQELVVTALDERIGATAGPDALDDANALIMLAGAVLRFAYKKDPDILDDPTSPVVAETIEVFRRTFKELS